ncbi:MAG TPA: shikimate kinase [Gemmatimonadaceae bacterium]|nr:shikimate kinase [Gemmatimonadaceae bacterium]
MSDTPQGAVETKPAHLILIGLPGAGKSTHGRRVARQLGRPFIDLDMRIASAAGRSVAQIFLEDGEAAFRAMEREATVSLGGQPPSVVAPGGGWMMEPANVELVKPGAVIIWLQVSPFVAVQRMGARVRLRPLLRSDDPVRTLDQLLEKRAHRYAGADAVVNTELFDWQGVADAIVALAPLAEKP